MRKDNSFAVVLVLIALALMIGVFLYRPTQVVYTNPLDQLPRDRTIFVVRKPNETVYTAVPWGFKTHTPRPEKTSMGRLPGGDWGQGHLTRPYMGGGLPGV